jgi:hypothetical protein
MNRTLLKLEHKKALSITPKDAKFRLGNPPFGQWLSAFTDDQALTAAMRDRLLRPAQIVQIAGGSHRLKDKRKAGRQRPCRIVLPALVNSRPILE